MLNLGHADSILVTHWSAGLPTRVLIGGGEAPHYEQILEFLKGRGITYLNYIVCSHPHDDHAAGLVGIVNGIEFSQAWMLIPSHHINLSVLRPTLFRSEARTVREIVFEFLRKRYV
jgi:beta-lactamase superfamily II metal-dependent hydrolase